MGPAPELRVLGRMTGTDLGGHGEEVGLLHKSEQFQMCRAWRGLCGAGWGVQRDSVSGPQKKHLGWSWAVAGSVYGCYSHGHAEPSKPSME